MCGVSGFLSSNENYFLGKKVIKSMTKSLNHRGPDNNDHWINSDDFVALGHNRLSIIDLSSNGDQPMISSSGRFIISYNGEIYNHLELRQELNKFKHIKWKSNTDTETILEMFENYGINESLIRFKGMFAIAIWDNKKKSLSLVRDRFGEKPLFFGWVSNSLVFASELKAIIQSIEVKPKISIKAVSCFLRLSYIPAPLTIYENFYKLGPGEKLEINNKGIADCYLQKFDLERSYSNTRLSKWWKLSKPNEYQKKYSEQIEQEVNLKIEASVKRQMISDVKNGVFLSGGIDSTLITALYQKNSIEKIKSFTIGSTNDHMDESNYARNVSDYLGTEHHELMVSSKDQIEIIEKLPEIYDEPFADSSQIPSILINKFACNHVKVALTGDGGDEIFCGYNRYVYSYKIWKLLNFLKHTKLSKISNILDKIPKKLLMNLEKIINFILKGDSGVSLLQEKIKKISEGLKYSKNLNELYFTHINSWQIDQNILVNEDLNFLPESFYFNSTNESDYISDMQLTDLKTYLPDDILCKSDRASMYSSLENRSPFLDQDIYDLSNSLPYEMKIKNNRGKYVLKKILKNYVPEKLFNRPKRGFSVPIGDWIRSEMLDWSENLLDIKNIKQYEFLNYNLIQKYWNSHKKNSHDHSKKIWNILILLSWLEKNRY